MPGEVFLVGGLVTLVGFVKQFTGVFQNFAWQYTQIVRYHTDVTTAQNILLAFDELHLPDEEEVLLNEWDTIYLKGLDFTHKETWKGEGSSQGLFNLDMQIRRAKKIALIGESGSGKSTLLALLRGLYPANAVTVTLDKKPIQLADIAAQVTLFPQEPEIFENTIAYNITLGLPFSAEEVEKACEIVHFSEVIKIKRSMADSP